MKCCRLQKIQTPLSPSPSAPLFLCKCTFFFFFFLCNSFGAQIELECVLFHPYFCTPMYLQGNRTTWRSPDDRKKTQTAVVWSCFPFNRSCQNHLARHSERGKKTRRTKEEVGRQPQGMDRPGVQQVPEGSGEQGKMEKTGCKIMCDVPTTLTIKGLLMMMICWKIITRIIRFC